MKGQVRQKWDGSTFLSVAPHWGQNQAFPFNCLRAGSLVALARKTNRTVILPRNIRNHAEKSINLPQAASILSIGKLVNFRFYVPQPLLQGSGDGMPSMTHQSIYRVQNHHSFQDSVQAIDHSASPMVAIDNGCRLIKEDDAIHANSYGNGTTDTATIKHSEVLWVMNQINWCLGARPLKFTLGPHGVADQFCEDFYARNPPGVTWAL